MLDVFVAFEQLNDVFDEDCALGCELRLFFIPLDLCDTLIRHGTAIKAFGWLSGRVNNLISHCGRGIDWLLNNSLN